MPPVYSAAGIAEAATTPAPLHPPIHHAHLFPSTTSARCVGSFLPTANVRPKTQEVGVADPTDGFLGDMALMAPYRHVARLPTKDVRVHFLRALVAWFPIDIPDGGDAVCDDRVPLAPSGNELEHRATSATKFAAACAEGGELHHLCNATRVLHTVSLLYDDIEDDSDTRRGEPCAHVKFGVPLTINAASAATFSALGALARCAADAAGRAARRRRLRRLGSTSPSLPVTKKEENVAGITSHATLPLNSEAEVDVAAGFWSDVMCGRLTRVCTEAMRRLHTGQGRDIWYRDTGRCPSMAEYETMCVEKTGGLFRLVAEWVLALNAPIAKSCGSDTNEESAFFGRFDGGSSLACTAPAAPGVCVTERLLAFCDRLGLCFQILDDLLNLCDDGEAVMKGYCEDLQEGKFSFLVVHAVWTLRAAVSAAAACPLASELDDQATGGTHTQKVTLGTPTSASTGETATILDEDVTCSCDSDGNCGVSDGVAEGDVVPDRAEPLLSLLRMRPREKDAKQKILSYLHATGSFAAAVAAVEGHCTALIKEIEVVDGMLLPAAVAAHPLAQNISPSKQQVADRLGEKSPKPAQCSSAVIGLLTLVGQMRQRATRATPCGFLRKI